QIRSGFATGHALRIHGQSMRKCRFRGLALGVGAKVTGTEVVAGADGKSLRGKGIRAVVLLPNFVFVLGAEVEPSVNRDFDAADGSVHGKRITGVGRVSGRKFDGSDAA